LRQREGPRLKASGDGEGAISLICLEVVESTSDPIDRLGGFFHQLLRAGDFFFEGFGISNRFCLSLPAAPA